MAGKFIPNGLAAEDAAVGRLLDKVTSCSVMLAGAVGNIARAVQSTVQIGAGLTALGAGDTSQGLMDVGLGLMGLGGAAARQYAVTAGKPTFQSVTLKDVPDGFKGVVNLATGELFVMHRMARSCPTGRPVPQGLAELFRQPM